MDFPKFVFPPRAEYKTNPERLSVYDNRSYYAQPKLNGSACIVMLHEDGRRQVWNRHGKQLSLIDYNQVTLNPLHRGAGWLILAGELLNKNKKGEDGQPFNQKFCLWDILMLNGKSLEGTTVIQRVEMISHLYPSVGFLEGDTQPKYLLNIAGAENCYVIPSYQKDFAKLYEELIKVDVYEGLVLKLKAGKLRPGLREVNNAEWQVKARKETKNYTF